MHGVEQMQQARKGAVGEMAKRGDGSIVRTAVRSGPGHTDPRSIGERARGLFSSGDEPCTATVRGTALSVRAGWGISEQHTSEGFWADQAQLGWWNRYE